ncbi:uncharacterized protein LOC123197483 [Mangifera indica]|uniref:uncharacterized protein LOC123197483 n=1 Tax=Mangifera indica TaxID=29780 RepID=UPI001CFBD676|nr:uncharacterized protein LOC123197483 [Mangifera indica]
MEATKFLSSTILPLHHGVSSSLLCRKNDVKKPYILSMGGSRGSEGRDYEGKLVDENMIVLRMRIREKKLSEAKYEPPSNWMEWERKYYLHYNQDICEAMGLLQSYLMNIRPGIAVGMIGVVAMSVAISTGLLLFQAVELAKIILFGFHLT